MGGLGAMNKSSNRANGTLPPREGVVFQIKDYFLVDPNKRTPNADDYIEAYLMRDALGIEAKFDDAGTAQTIVKIKLAKPKEGDTSKERRPTLIDFHNGKGPLGKPMPANSIGKADGCYYDQKTGFIISNWMNRKFPNFDVNANWPLTNVMASVRGEYMREHDGQKNYSQARIVVLPEYSQVVTDVATFRAAAIAAVDSLRAQDEASIDYPGVLGFVLRGVNVVTLERAAVEVYSFWNKALERNPTSEELVDGWLAGEEGQGWVSEVINGADKANQILEVFPATRIDTGLQSLPSSQKANAITNRQTVDEYKDHRFDDSARYRFQPKSETNKYPRTGFAKSDVFVQRDKVQGSDEFKRWYAIGAEPISQQPELFDLAEVPSPKLPADLIERLREAAREHSARPAGAPEQEQAPEAGTNYGM